MSVITSMPLRIGSITGFVHVLLALLFSSQLLAFSPARPKQHDVFSPNHRFVLDANPASKEQRIYASVDRSKELWSFTEELWQEQFYVADDGESVAVVYWCFSRVEGRPGPAARFVGRNGTLASYSTARLCPAPYTTTQVVGPIGDFWRRWLHRSWQEGPDLLLTTVDGHEYRFSLATGRIVGHRQVDPMPMNDGYVAWQNAKLVFALMVTAGCTCALWFFFRSRIRRCRLSTKL
jgi:hypothetical protein